MRESTADAHRPWLTLLSFSRSVSVSVSAGKAMDPDDEFGDTTTAGKGAKRRRKKK